VRDVAKRHTRTWVGTTVRRFDKAGRPNRGEELLVQRRLLISTENAV
jgi:hypothetical protein